MKKRYPKEALKAGLTKEDLEIIKAIENYNELDFNNLCSNLGVKDDYVIKEIVKEVIQNESCKGRG